MCYAGHLNNFTYLRALLVLHDRGIVWPRQLAALGTIPVAEQNHLHLYCGTTAQVLLWYYGTITQVSVYSPYNTDCPYITRGFLHTLCVYTSLSVYWIRFTHLRALAWRVLYAHSPPALGAGRVMVGLRGCLCQWRLTITKRFHSYYMNRPS
jgi:hypothetical protein